MIQPVFLLLSVATSLPLPSQTTSTRENSPDKPPSVRPANEPLRIELLAMVREDQDLRQQSIQARQNDSAIIKKVLEIDRKNTARLKVIVAGNGWPGRSLVGNDGAHAAWLLVQHADADRAFQRQCLALMDKARAGEVDRKDVAYLTDRVLVADGKLQRFGTQYKQVKGVLTPAPIEDEEHVDSRRQAIGLGTMAEYKKQLESVYHPARK